VQDTMTATVTRVREPFDAYVIADLNVRGYGTRSYVDPQTWLLVRNDVIRAAGTATYLYDDFRTIDGYTRAWHWRVRDGYAEDDQEYRIEGDFIAPISADVFTIPPSRRNLVEFPPGVSSVSIPTQEDHSQFIVRVNVGSRGLDFLLDTGASGIALDEGIAAELGLKLYAPRSNGVNAGRYVSESAIVPEMQIGALSMRDVVVQTIPHLGADRMGQYKIVGLLGFDFINAVSLKLDYEKGQVTAYDPATFAPPVDPQMNVLDVRLSGGQPLTSVSINGAVGERFVIDSGAYGGVKIFDYFARRYPEALADEGGVGAARQVEHRGVGGTFDVRTYRLSVVRLGDINFHDFLADVVATRSAYGTDEDGLIGTDFLHLFTVYTDYRNSRIYLVPTLLMRQAL